MVFYGKLMFSLHVKSVECKARSSLGFIKRRSRDFDDPFVTKGLYKLLVSPLVEYVSPIWPASYNYYVDISEAVPKQFLMFGLRDLG